MNKQLLTIACSMFLVGVTKASSLGFESNNLNQSKNITEVLNLLEKKFNVRFNYESKISNVKIDDNFNIKNIRLSKLEEFIEKATFRKVEVSRVKDNYYVLHELKPPRTTITTDIPEIVGSNIEQTQNAISGKIISKETGEPLSNVTIRVKGTNKSAQTNNKGEFNFSDVSSEAVLVVSLMGFQTIEVNAASSNLIELSSNLEGIDEVVVTALGIKKEQRALGYSTQKVKGEDLQKVKGVDIGTTLTGRVAGLRVLNSTEFNATPNITLRGGNPILVIDGVKYENMTLRDVPVDNIESIDVLKGGVAAALYGADGQNGAIMITTKKGLSQQGTDVEFNTNNMFFSGYLALPEVQSSYSAGYGGKYNTDDEVWGDKLDIGRMYKQWNPLTKQIDDVATELTSRGKNNFSDFLEPGFITNNSISFTNQGEHGSIRTSISHVFNKGQYPNTKLNMTNISLAGETRISDKLSLDSRFGFNRRYSPNNFGAGYGAQGYIYNILVWTGPEYDLSQYKDYWLIKDEKQNWHYNAWYDNPYLSAYEKLSSELINKLNAAVSLKYKISKWGDFQLRSGYDSYANAYEQTNPRGIFGTRGGWDGYASNGRYRVQKRDGFGTQNDAIFTFQVPVNDFRIDGIAGGAIAYRIDNYITASTVNGIAIPGFYSLKNSVDPASTTESKTKDMTNSVYGKLSVSWKNAIFLEGTGRNDWASVLPKETSSYFYPSVSASVILTDLFEQLKSNYLSYFKLRGGLVETKALINPYEINQVFSISTNVWDGLSTASYPNEIKDFTISPTTRTTKEFGFDVSLFNNRVSASYTRYNRLIHNQAIKAKISSASGFSERFINTKEHTMDKGHEISISANTIKKEHFNWNVSANLTQHHNYYHQLDSVYSADAPYVKVGLRTDHYVTRDWERTADGQIIHNASGMPISAAHANRLYGYTAPKWFWGLTNQFDYKDFSLSFSLDGRIGGLSYSNMNARLLQTGAHPDLDTKERYEEVVNGNKTYIAQGMRLVSGAVDYDKYGDIVEDTRVLAPNDVVVSFENYWKRAYSGTRNIWDETFVKLREISINYRIPTSYLQHVGLKKASIGMTGQNLFLWTKQYKFSDPDAGSEDLNSPSMRYLGFNINVNF